MVLCFYNSPLFLSKSQGLLRHRFIPDVTGFWGRIPRATPSKRKVEIFAPRFDRYPYFIDGTHAPYHVTGVVARADHQ